MRLKSNISKLYASYFLNGIVFFYGIEKVFYETIGIDEVGIGAITVAYLVIALLLDIPSGVLADKWSRKNVLILSTLMLIASSIIGGLSQGLGHYLVAASVWGGYFILISGTYEALTYDSLHQLKQTKLFSRVLGRQNALFLVGLVFSSAASGLIAEASSLRATYFLSVIPALINLVVVWSIVEPTFHKDIADHKLSQHIKTAINYLFSTVVMRRLSVVLIAMILLETTVDEYGQVAFIDLGFSTAAIGILTAVYAGSQAIGHVTAYKLSSVRTLLLPALAASFAGFAFVQERWALSLLFLAVLLRSVLENLNETDIQDNIDSSVRATTLSVLGFVANLISIPVVVVFGYIARENGVYAAFQILSVLYVLIALFALGSRLLSSSRRVA